MEYFLIGGTAVADYNSVTDGDKIIQTAVKAFGTVHVLINNAGILRDKSVVKLTDADWGELLKTSFSRYLITFMFAFLFCF